MLVVGGQKSEAVPRRARIEGSYTCVSLNPRLESNRAEKKVGGVRTSCSDEENLSRRDAYPSSAEKNLSRRGAYPLF